MVMKLIIVMIGVGLSVGAVACGNPPTAAEQTATAGAPAATATPGDAATAPGQLSAPGGLVAATVAPVSPVAAGEQASRSDCPGSWSTFNAVQDSASACAPSNLTSTSYVDDDGSFGLSLSTSDSSGVPQPGAPGVLVAVRLSSNPVFAPNLPLAQVCKSGGHAEGTVAELAVGELTMRGCHVVEEANDPVRGPLESLILVAPYGSGKFLEISVNWRTNDSGAAELASGIARTVRIAS